MDSGSGVRLPEAQCRLSASAGASLGCRLLLSSLRSPVRVVGGKACPLCCSDVGPGAWLPSLALGTGRPHTRLDSVWQAPGTLSTPCSVACETLGS